MLWWMMQNVPWFERLYWRYRCPRPIIKDGSARACVKSGYCGCDNARRYQ